MFKVVIAYLLADFVTGFLHWLEDRYGNVEWGNWLYKAVVLPNIIHHESPREMIRSGYWQTVKLSFFIGMPVIGVGLVSHNLVILFFAVIAINANEIHKWAHRSERENGILITWLQRFWIIQSRRQHQKHHTRPFDTSFCVVTPWLNPVLNRIKFWSALESIIVLLSGIQTITETQRRIQGR
jgi:ubiquitin-conjugating enzyme E2 variant